LTVIENARVVNDSLKGLLVPNMVPHTVLGREALEALTDFGLEVSMASLGQRTAYREAAIEGTTIQALGHRARQAVAELEALCDQVQTELQ
jgi:chromosome partitioning protein